MLADSKGDHVMNRSTRLLILVMVAIVPASSAWAGGKPLGSEFQVNTYTTHSQEVPAIASDAVGNFVIVWESYKQVGSYSGIFAQRFNSVGVPQGSEFRVNAVTTASQEKPTVAFDGLGNFIITWESHDYDGS